MIADNIKTTIHNQYENGDLRPMCSMWIAKQHSGDAGYVKTICRMYCDEELIAREDHNLAKSR